MTIQYKGTIGRTIPESKTVVAGLSAAAGGGAERAGGPVRRSRLLASRLLRLLDRDAEHRSAGRRRLALHELPHHGAVLADPGGAADGTQPSFGRHARARQLEHRLSELHRHGGQERRHDRRDAAAARLFDLRRRQVAPDADGRDVGRWPIRPVAAGARVRPLLRLPAGRDRPVLAGALLRQPSGRCAAHAGAGLSPERGPGRPGDRHGAQPEVGDPGKAVLPLSRLRRDACAAPGAAGLCRQV